ncbi:MAG: hypothetical protein H0W88_04990 [Parachlamydiaceae bacterium]|nr:hypothetical protein [Parachlamydiaceae bacterium]
MDFTREPIIETIITPKDGCKLVVRSSKGVSQEEYFVDAVEIVSFAHSFFFRSLERPKSFLVPVTDYEVVEVREARMVLKNVSSDRSIKIGGGRESGREAPKESGREGGGRQHREVEKVEAPVSSPEEVVVASENGEQPAGGEARPDPRLDKKRDRRRHYRKRRNGKDEGDKEEGSQELIVPQLEEGGRVDIPVPEMGSEKAEIGVPPLSSAVISSLLQPPPTLISETISRYRENALFKSAFFLTEEEQYKPHDKAQDLLNEDDDELKSPAHPQECASIDVAKEESSQARSDEEVKVVENIPENITSDKIPTEQPEPVKKRESRKKQEGISEIKEEVALPLFADDGFNGTKIEESPFLVEGSIAELKDTEEKTHTLPESPIE